jgi:peroxiredoxin Q/BCP
MSTPELNVAVGDRFPTEILDGLHNQVQAADGMTAIYLYPADNTPTCTRQAVEFQRASEALSAARVQVIGVSTDDEESHRGFAEDNDLSLGLVADPERRLVQELGALRDYGEYGELSDRVTFLVDGEGIIRRIWHVDDVVAHPAEVLAAAAELTDQQAK